MWDQMDGYAKQCHYVYDIYLLWCLVLECFIIIDREIGTTEHNKDVVGGLNYREK